MAEGNLKTGVTHTVVKHDSWCAMYEGKDCNCNPVISRATEEQVCKMYAEGRSVGQNQRKGR